MKHRPVRDKFHPQCFRIKETFERGNEERCKDCKWRLNCLTDKDWIHEHTYGEARVWASQKDGVVVREYANGKVILTNLTNEVRNIKVQGFDILVPPHQTYETELPF